MSRRSISEIGTVDAATYHIRIRGHLDQRWRHRIAGFALLETERETLLEGTPPDQSALLGVLNLIHDLGLQIVDVDRIEPGEPRREPRVFPQG